MNKSWFDLRPSVKRTYAKAVWIPLHISDSHREGDYNAVSYRSTFEGAHSIAVPLEKRELAQSYSWSDSHDARPWSEPGFYKTADTHSLNQEVELGFRLVLRQHVADQPHEIWHLHQDFVIALELLREGDVWVRPAEDYVEVARLRRNQGGEPAGIEVKAEYLRDYLCARNCALRIASYRERSAILEELGDIDFGKGPSPQEIYGGRLEERAWAIDSSGSPYGTSVGVFRMSRNDIDPEDDVPVMGPESNDNVDSSSWSFKRENGKRYRVASEFWRDEWVEPALESLRVRGDHIPSQVTFVVDADGTRVNADDLDDEDVGRWLWFGPGVVASLLARRGSRLEWYTRETGGLSTPSDPSVHFGVNESGLVTVYAYDVARLPEWERRFWAGFNVSPEGKVSSELLSSQVRAEVADSQAPEAFFGKALKQLETSWHMRFNSVLIRGHAEGANIQARVHRFRAVDRPGLLALAKDIARLTADSIDVANAQIVAPPSKGEKLGSLKSLERALATVAGIDIARNAMSPLFAVYDLRLSDAHLPRSDMLDSFKILGITDHDPNLIAGCKMIHAAVSSLYQCSAILRGKFPPSIIHKAET